MIKIKRIYEKADSGDGFRVLVDRLWPRGVSKEKAGLDLWLKDIGPTNNLRKWFGHKPEKFNEFCEKYLIELASNPAAHELKDLVKKHKTITLLYSAKDEEHNQAVVLRDFLEN